MFKRIIERITSEPPAETLVTGLSRWILRRHLRRIYRQKRRSLIDARVNLAIIDSIHHYQQHLNSEDDLRSQLAKEQSKDPGRKDATKIGELQMKINQVAQWKNIRETTAGAVRELEQTLTYLEE